MSIARQFLNEFRPLFRMLDEPIARSPASLSLRHRSFFDDPFFNSPALVRPAVDMSEEADKYIIEAELPGVSKEDVNVSIGNQGRSVTIEGKVALKRSEPGAASSDVNEAKEAAQTEGAPNLTTSSVEQTNQLSAERQLVGNTSFTRSVWLPRPIDGNSVSAQLKDGILTLTLPKSEDKGSVKVAVE